MNDTKALQGRIKLSSEQRQQEILNILNNEYSVKFSDLSVRFNVTEMTIRRDIEKLEHKNLLHRTLRGAILAPIRELNLRDRMKLMTNEKMRIGKVAASIIKPKEAIFIDSGTTTTQIVRYLHHKDITVVTNAPKIALELQEKGIPVILLGGHLEGSTLSAIGPIAEANIREMNFHRAFIAAAGISAMSGLSNSNYFELQVKKLAMEQSQEVNVLVDSSKFESDSLVSFADFDNINRIITDSVLPKSILSKCRQHEIDILIASGEIE